MRRRNTDALAEQLVAECAAFLSGSYASYLTERCRPVPVWAWTNLLAHATEADLLDLMRAPASFTRASGHWAHACAYLAGEVLDLAGRHGPLPQLQTRLLIPLELDLATRTELNAWGPRPWVMAVTTALDDYRRTRKRQARTQPRRSRDA